MENQVASAEILDTPHGDPCGCEDFFLVAARFEAMQREHLVSLAEGDCADVFSWGQKREELSRLLIRQLERITGVGSTAGDCVVQVKSAVKRLLDAEKVLEDCLAVRRSRLKEQLSAMHKGKDALHGYSLYRGGRSRPRYLSNRT